ncbi:MULTISPECIES: hypothetical protein [Burkholderia]|uniref:Uncharacterized protein n=1 Tax=Burkholderia aenigmatica TaxID=2015348 RepID=A0A6J5J353_9BURK|nr:MULTISPECIES: hypothetical protein [Burkholderia]CAB3965994.1 hypothetical protein BLA3211_03700 [Burkholderia aenigmatica]
MARDRCGNQKNERPSSFIPAAHHEAGTMWNLITPLRLPAQTQISHKPCYQDSTILSMNSRAGPHADRSALAEIGQATVDGRLRNAAAADNVNLRFCEASDHSDFDTK